MASQDFVFLCVKAYATDGKVINIYGLVMVGVPVAGTKVQ